MKQSRTKASGQNRVISFASPVVRNMQYALRENLLDLIRVNQGCQTLSDGCPFGCRRIMPFTECLKQAAKRLVHPFEYAMQRISVQTSRRSLPGGLLLPFSVAAPGSD